MPYISTLFLLLLVLPLSIAKSTLIPACLTSCMEPFPGNHEPDTCTDRWLATLSTCINNACPYSPVSIVNNAADNNLSMQFAPKLEYPCEQAVLPGNYQNANSISMVLAQGKCSSSPFYFQSFVASANATAGQMAILQVYNQTSCFGTAENISLDLGSLTDGLCNFVQGQSVRLVEDSNFESMSQNAAAHAYLDLLCAQSSGTGFSSLLSPTSTTSSGLSTGRSTTTSGMQVSPFSMMTTSLTRAVPLTTTSMNIPDPTTAAGNGSATVFPTLGGNSTTNATVPSFVPNTPVGTADPWQMRFVSGAPKQSAPALLGLLSTIAIVLLSGGAWDKKDKRHSNRSEKKE